MNQYRQGELDGAVEMGQDTDVWLKASQLPLRKTSPEQAPIRELTEAEKTIIEIHKAANMLQALKNEREKRQAA